MTFLSLTTRMILLELKLTQIALFAHTVKRTDIDRWSFATLGSGREISNVNLIRKLKTVENWGKFFDIPSSTIQLHLSLVFVLMLLSCFHFNRNVKNILHNKLTQLYIRPIFFAPMITIIVSCCVAYINVLFKGTIRIDVS